MSALPPFLTEEEIAAATAPLTQGAARIRFFRRLGCKVEPKPNGQPIVGRAEYEAVMLSHKPAPAAKSADVVMPDWDALRQAVHGRRA